MALALNYEFLFVGRDEESFLENYAYDISEEDEGREGHLFVSVEVQNNPADAEKIGDIIFDNIRSAYFEASQYEDSYDRFEDSLKEVNKRLKKLKAEKVSGYIGNLNVLIAVFQNGILHLTQCGDSEAYLIRRRFVSSISEGLSDGGDSDDVFSNIASGTVESGDMIVFSSTRLLRYMTKNDLARSSTSHDAVAILSDLKDLISTEILGKVGLAAIVFNQVDDPLMDSDIPTLESREEEERNMPEQADMPVLTKKSRFKISLPALSFKGLKSTVNSWHGSLKSEGLTKQRILGLLIGVIILLTLGIWYAKDQANKRDFLLELDQKLSEVGEHVNTAKTQGQYDKEAAAVTLSLAESKAMEVLNSGYYRSKANEILQNIQGTKDLLDNVNRISSPKVYADLSTKRDNVSALGILGSSRDGHLFVFEYNALYELILNEIQDPVTLDDSEVVIAGSDFDDRNSLVFLTKSGKLLEYRDGTINFMDTQDGAFHKAVDLEDWGSRMYLLDSENNQIWRYSYSGARDQFSVGEAYNNNAELGNGRALVIDGSIYVLNQDGTIVKLFTGDKQDLPIKKQPFSTPRNASKIWTDADTTQLFILDSDSSKIFVYLKDNNKGELVYSHQYLFENLSDIRDFHVDKEANKMYVLDATKVYELTL